MFPTTNILHLNGSSFFQDLINNSTIHSFKHHPFIHPSFAHFRKKNYEKDFISKLYLIQERKNSFLSKAFEPEKRQTDFWQQSTFLRDTQFVNDVRIHSMLALKFDLKTSEVLSHANWINLNLYWNHVSFATDVALSA